METIFRKVSVRERLPKEAKAYFTLDSENFVDVQTFNGEIFDTPNCDVIYWLEEIELPSEKQMTINAEMYAEQENDCYTNDYNGHLKGQKEMRNFVFGG